MMLPVVGSSMPHVAITTREGGVVQYVDLWQREQILLVIVPSPGSVAAAGPWAHFEARLADARTACRDMETAVVLTGQAPAGFEAPLALVADRWGEITHAAALSVEADAVTPDVPTLLTWVEATLHRCPECEGEAR